MGYMFQCWHHDSSRDAYLDNDSLDKEIKKMWEFFHIGIKELYSYNIAVDNFKESTTYSEAEVDIHLA